MSYDYTALASDGEEQFSVELAVHYGNCFSIYTSAGDTESVNTVTDIR